MTPAKQLVKSAFDLLGLEVRKKCSGQPQPMPRASMAGVLSHLCNLGLRPQTVIDVGVATQTEELYQQFRRSKILLIEPLAEFEPFLRDICSLYDAEYVLAAAGENRGSAMLNVHRDKYGSSLLKETEGASVDGISREVPVVTIDDLCSEKNLSGPFWSRLMSKELSFKCLRVLPARWRKLTRSFWK
jgi:FkbM family methyltransferase